MLISPFHKWSCTASSLSIVIKSPSYLYNVVLTDLLADGAIGKTSEFGINPVSQGAEQDVAGYNSCYNYHQS